MARYQYNYKFFANLPESMYSAYLRKFYKEIMGVRLALDKPKRLSEKIQYLKLYDVTPDKVRCTDKLKVRDYCRERVPELKFAQVYTSADSFEGLDFNACPNEFVVKCNHACQVHVFVENKDNFLKNYDFQKVHWNKLLTQNYAFSSYFEMQYKDIERKLYVEEFIRNTEQQPGYFEYRVDCFNGEPKLIEFFMKDKAAIFDPSWNKLDVGYKYHPKLEDNEIIKPKNLDKMIEYAKILSKDFKFVRVDFYERNDELYLSEMTFTPFSGFIQYNPPEYDEKFGQWLTI